MPGNLPAEPNSFIGRERDLAELVSMLGRVRALTLCGPGGIGKTRLALRLAARMASGYPDGAWIADLADADAPDRLVPLLTAALSIRQEPDRPLAETLIEALRPRTMLLILDTCEHVVQESAELVQRLLGGCHGLTVIATSREPLRVRGEIIWRVPPLGLPLTAEDTARPGAAEVRASEAVRLFVARAAAARPGFDLHATNMAAIADVCRTLDGVPLAIELAAARVRALSAEQISIRLADRFKLLALGDRTAPPRQQTLRAAVEWSHDLLAGPERMLLSRLFVFHGWSLEMAEQVCADAAIPSSDVLDLLTALIDKSLVSVDAELNGVGRYRLLDTVRELAQEQAVAAGELPRLQVAHRDCMLALVEEVADRAFVRGDPSWPERVAMYHRVRADRANFHLALACCVQRGEAEAGLRMCVALSGSWLASGDVSEGSSWIDRLLAIDQAEPSGIRARAHAVRAELAFEQQDYQGAEQHARACLELSAACQDGNPASGLRLLALTALMAGRGGDAMAHADAAVAAARQMGDDWELGVALASRAAVISSQGMVAEAQLAYQQALDTLTDNNGWGVANVLYGLGQIARNRRDAADAARYFGESLAIYRQIDARPEMARCLAGIGWVALSQGDLATARASLTQSMRLSLVTGQRLPIARGLAALAALGAAAGEIEPAVVLASAAMRVFEASGVPRSAASVRRLDDILDDARTRLGSDAVAALLTESKNISPHQAAFLAMARPGSESAAGRAGAEQDPAGSLTEREREVAVLVARGLSNRAIGAQLFISQATAARHVANIFVKLGFSSRAQVVAWVAAHEPPPTYGVHSPT